MVMKNLDKIWINELWQTWDWSPNSRIWCGKMMVFKKRNLLFHSECTNQPFSVEPATEEVFHVELKDRKNKPKTKPQTIKNRESPNPPNPLVSPSVFFRGCWKGVFSKKGHSSRPGVPSACRLDKPSNCLGWRCSSRFPAAWNHPIGGWKKSSGKNSRKSQIWNKFIQAKDCLDWWFVLFGEAFFFKFEVRSCLHPKKKWNFPVGSFQAKACIPKKKLATLHSSKPSV